MSSAQEKTIGLYRTLMQMNASAHLLRIARDVGLLEALEAGQKTIDEICVDKFLHRDTTMGLLDALVTIGIVEKYGDDYAISQAARLLSQYDQDLGDKVWNGMSDLLLGKTKRESIDDRERNHRDAATQWIHTPAAMQAAEMLDLGNETPTEEVSQPANVSDTSFRLLDLGCGSGVWSSAIAHRASHAKIVAVDFEAMRHVATQTAHSVGLESRYEFVASDPTTFIPETGDFDVVLIAQRLHCESDEAAENWLKQVSAFLKPGGKLVVIDLFQLPGKTTLSVAIDSLRLMATTRKGRLRALEETQAMFRGAGLKDVQFSFLAADRSPLGLAVGTR